MSSDVFANGMEIACKASDGKSIASFPDVCFTPPQAPPTPPGVPLPYPNTGMASDATEGSTSVKIHGKEVMLKNKSYFQKSTGDEAGAAPLKGLISKTNMGKVYFTAWSMDVKVEGENVVRHFDMTTHNHASMPGNTAPWMYTASMNVGEPGQPIKECKNEAKAIEDNCKGKDTREEQCAHQPCADAKKCALVSYNQGKRKSSGSQVGCCEGEQPHHLVEAHCFYEVGQRGAAAALKVQPPSGKVPYDDDQAPCVCASGPRHLKKHGQYHRFQGAVEAAHHQKAGGWTYGQARDCGVAAHSAVNPQCSENCTKGQLDAFHKDQCGMTEETPLRTDPKAGTRSAGRLNAEQRELLQNHLDEAVHGIGAA